IMGGAQGDTITASLGGDIILGDGGQANLTGVVETTTPEEGGNDHILGGEGTELADRSILIGGAGEDEIIGGAGGNDIEASGGSDVIVGDNGEVLFNLGIIRTTYPGAGAADKIKGGSGENSFIFFFERKTAYEIETGSGNAVIVGDD